MCVAMNFNQPAFQGKYDRTNRGNAYYKTDNAMKVGATYAGIGAGFGLLSLPREVKVSGAGPAIIGAILGSGISFAMHAGIGAYIDSKRNKHAREATDYINAVGVQKAVMTRKDIAIARNGRAYYESNDGAKYGTRIGAGIGGITGGLMALGTALTSNAIFKSMPKEIQQGVKHFKTKSAIGAVILGAAVAGIGAFGGWILGKISDHYTNKNAEKHA